MNIYCCGCGKEVEARLTNGTEIYPHRSDLADLPFWKCDTCHNYVGCHHKTKDRTKPLGCIPTAHIRNARSQIHALIDTVCEEKRLTKTKVYKALSRNLGYEYHSGNISSMEEAQGIVDLIKFIFEM